MVAMTSYQRTVLSLHGTIALSENFRTDEKSSSTNAKFGTEENPFWGNLRTNFEF